MNFLQLTFVCFNLIPFENPKPRRKFSNCSFIIYECSQSNPCTLSRKFFRLAHAAAASYSNCLQFKAAFLNRRVATRQRVVSDVQQVMASF